MSTSDVLLCRRFHLTNLSDLLTRDFVPANQSASMISGRDVSACRCRRSGSLIRFNSEGTSSSRRGTSANGSLGIVASRRFKHRRVYCKIRKNPYAHRTSLLANWAPPPAITTTNRVFPVFPARKRCDYICAPDSASTPESGKMKASHRRV